MLASKPFVAAARPQRAQVVVKAAAWQKATTSEFVAILGRQLVLVVQAG
jgi:hypothetical protein